MNIVARSEELYKKVVATIARVFPAVLQMEVEDDVNRIVIGLLPNAPSTSSKVLIQSAGELQVNRFGPMPCFRCCCQSALLGTIRCRPTNHRVPLEHRAAGCRALHQASCENAWGAEEPNARWPSRVKDQVKAAIAGTTVIAGGKKKTDGAGGGGSGSGAPGAQRRSTSSKKKKKKR